MAKGNGKNGSGQSDGIAVKEAAGISVVPEHLRGEKVGTEVAAQYRTTPYCKIVQGQSSTDLKEQFPERTVLLVPEKTVIVSGKDSEFVIVPIMMFDTFEKWSDIDDDEQNLCVGRSLDRTSDLAKRCLDRTRRIEDYPDGRKNSNKAPMRYRYVQSINVLAVIDGCDENPEVVGSPMMFSYNKGEFQQGRRFCTAVDRRAVSIFGCRFAMKTAVHKSRDGKYSWYGLENANPTEAQGGPWVNDKDKYEDFRRLHIGFDESVKSGAFEILREDDGDGGAASDEAPGEGDRPSI